MADSSDIMRLRQSAIRRELDRRGIALKVVALDSRMSYSTILSYFPAGDQKPAVMPISAAFALAESRAIPDDLLTLLLPSGCMIVRIPDDADYDEMERACRDFLSTKGQAHHPGSPDGREISICEDDELAKSAARLRAVVG